MNPLNVTSQNRLAASKCLFILMKKAKTFFYKSALKCKQMLVVLFKRAFSILSRPNVTYCAVSDTLNRMSFISFLVGINNNSNNNT